MSELQRQIVLAELRKRTQEGRTFNSIEAEEVFSLKLPQRVKCLEYRGFVIGRRRADVVDRNGKLRARVCHYWLIAEPRKAGEAQQ